MRRPLRPTLAALALLALATRARANEPRPDASALETRRAALVAFGVPEDDGALVQGDAASRRCAAAPRSCVCSIASASYELAAARRELAELRALAAELRVTDEAIPDARARTLATTLAHAELARLSEAERESAGISSTERSTLVRVLTELLRVRVVTAHLRAALDAQAVATDANAALEVARRLAAAAAEGAARDDDTYRARYRGERERAALRAQAATRLSADLERRISALPEADRPSFTADLTTARALVDADARLAALLAIVDAIEARERHTP